jgi:hypothetical protein
MATTLRKEDLLTYLRDYCDICDPPQIILLEELIATIETGAFDNSRTKKQRIPVKCTFERKHLMVIPDEENGGICEVITYHCCRMYDLGADCPHPSILCSVKVEDDQFIDHMVCAINRSLKPDSKTDGC